MYIGVGIFLLLIGLIIVFAYSGDTSIAGIDITAIGWIAIALGALAIILSLVLDRTRRPVGYTTTRRTGGRVDETRIDPDDRRY